MNASGATGVLFTAGVVVALFFLIFPLFWCAIVGLIARMGWRRLAAAYPATSDPPYSATRIRFATISIGDAIAGPNYGSSINAWLSETGLWLRPILLFRFSHPMIFIPWAGVQSVESERRFLVSRAHVRLESGMPDLWLSGRLGRVVLERGLGKHR